MNKLLFTVLCARRHFVKRARSVHGQVELRTDLMSAIWVKMKRHAAVNTCEPSRFQKMAKQTLIRKRKCIPNESKPGEVRSVVRGKVTRGEELHHAGLIPIINNCLRNQPCWQLFVVSQITKNQVAVAKKISTFCLVDLLPSVSSSASNYHT